MTTTQKTQLDGVGVFMERKQRDKKRKERELCLSACVYDGGQRKRKKRAWIMSLLGWFTSPAMPLLPVSFNMMRLVRVCVCICVLCHCLNSCL